MPAKRLDPENFLKFPQYVGFSAYLIVKAGSSYRLLNDNQAETGGKEVEKLYARILGSSEVWEKSKYEIAKSIRR